MRGRGRGRVTESESEQSDASTIAQDTHSLSSYYQFETADRWTGPLTLTGWLAALCQQNIASGIPVQIFAWGRQWRERGRARYAEQERERWQGTSGVSNRRHA